MLTDDILNRLVASYRVIETITDSPRPKAYGSSMPDLIRFATDSDVWRAQIESLKDDNGATFRQMQADRVRDFARTARSQFTPREIQEAEVAMSWPALVDHPVHREILVLYVICKARRGKWSEWLANRNRRKPQQYGVIRRTAQRWINQSLQEIETKLRHDARLWRG
jgi:hypothetical protein